jgi:phosphoribosyl 1,2-cyclic phosphodiesterase
MLGSSSSGNCGLLLTPQARILIDAGFSCKRIRQGLARHGVAIEDIDAVFITHEHSDHCAGVAGLAKLGKPVFFANEGTARAVNGILARTSAPPPWRVFETGTVFKFADVDVSAFSIPHDAADPVGYTFSVGGETLVWATDLGHAPRLVREKINQADFLVLEANYDEQMLMDSQRPPSLKQRIRGRHGHLSNESAQEILMTTPCGRLRRVCLAHLSRECNSPERVNEALALVRPLHPECVFEIVAPDSL